MSDTEDEAVPPPPARPKLILDKPGIYDGVEEADYHADPCPAPSLSRTVLKRLVGRSARHAYIIHPKLGAIDEADSNDEIADYGAAAHRAFLQGAVSIRRLDFPDWRTKKAKDARAQAYADGEIPLLTKSYGRAMRLIDVLEEFRRTTGAFTGGKPEQTVVWQDGPVWCRARVDWLPDDPAASPWDLKTTDGAAQLSSWSRIAFDKGYDLQDSFYCRGLEHVRGEPPSPMKFCVVEQRPPFGIGVFEMAPITRDFADDDIREGLRSWEECLSTDRWPSYPVETQYVEPPGWVLRAREAQMTPRNADLLRGREHPNAVEYVTTGNFGG